MEFGPNTSCLMVGTSRGFVIVWDLRYRIQLLYSSSKSFPFARNCGKSCTSEVLEAPSVFFLLFRKWKQSTPQFFAPFGGDFSEFCPVLNQISFEIRYFCAPQAIILSILHLKNYFLSFFDVFSEKSSKILIFFISSWFFSHKMKIYDFFILNEKILEAPKRYRDCPPLRFLFLETFTNLHFWSKFWTFPAPKCGFVAFLDYLESWNEV